MILYLLGIVTSIRTSSNDWIDILLQSKITILYLGQVEAGIFLKVGEGIVVEGIFLSPPSFPAEGHLL